MFAKIIILSLPSHLECQYIYSLDEKGAAIGKRVEVDFNGKKRIGIIYELLSIPPSFKTKNINKVIDDTPLVTPELFYIAKWMTKFYSSSLSQTLSLMLPSKSSSGSAKIIDTPPAIQPPPLLTSEQEDVYNKISNKIDSSSSHSPLPPLYLWGVTGSGKTLVYLKLAKKIADSGKNVLYLVPEIGLTIQLYSQVLSFFNKDEVGILHSSLTPAKRIQIWKKTIKGDLKIIIGTRSAVFTPLSSLGLIVMDEEQDGSYKSENAPRFSTRHIALLRAKRNNCPLLCGSATPSFEFIKEIEEKRVEVFYLNKRINDYKLPKISVVNSLSSPSPLTPFLKKSMKEELDKGRQVILFLNRRGFLYHYKCPSCSFELLCPHCSVSMTYHKEKNLFLCHRCGHSSPPIDKCPKCGDKNEIYTGYGTELVEKIVNQLFPFSITLRMDTDTITSEKKAREIINTFETGKADILIGTQMISKGLTFPSVSLVGVLNASTNLSSSDFRSDEKLFSLLTQVAGRSGRALKNSRVIIQTDDEENNAIMAIKANEPEKFYKNELEIRQKLKYPPYSRLGKILVRSKDEFCAEKIISNIAYLANFYIKQFEENHKQTSQGANDYISVFSYGKCPIYKEKDYYRMSLILKSNNINYLVRIINAITKQIHYNPAFHIEIDIDPVNML